jgi:homoserine O-acetyltransferase
MGGMSVLEWPLLFPVRYPPHTPTNVDSSPPTESSQPYIRSIVPIATAARHSAWCISWAEAQRQSIYSDPLFNHGYYSPSSTPRAGLSAARMAALLTYRSRDSFESRFGRRIGGAKKATGTSASNGLHTRQPSSAEEAVSLHNEGNLSPRVVGNGDYSRIPSGPESTLPPARISTAESSASRSIGKVFSAQSYLRYQGDKFVKRFDANCYIHLTRKMDTHDVARGRAHWGLGGPDEKNKNSELNPIEVEDVEKALDEVNLGERRLPREGEEDDEALIRVLSFLSSGSYRFGAPPPKVQVVSIESDGLFAPPEQDIIYQLINGSKLVSVKSNDGHDGFLLEFDQINHHVGSFLRETIADVFVGDGVGYEEWREWGKTTGAGGQKAMQISEAETDDITRW